MIISEYFIWFLIYSFFGWIFETLYCTIHSGVWENRGFMYGPVCPIYGVGAVTVTALYQWIEYMGLPQGAVWQIFLVGFLGSIPLEYVTHWYLEKKFHAYWWDYSDMPLNINGRICLPASTLFGIAAVGIICGSRSVIGDITAEIPPLILELISMIGLAVFVMDLTLTVSVLTRFAKEVERINENVNNHMDTFVNTIQEKTQDMGQRILEERERFSMQAIEEYASHMTASAKDAISRIPGFRLPKPKGLPHPAYPEKGREFFSHIASQTKRYVRISLHRKDDDADTNDNR